MSDTRPLVAHVLYRFAVGGLENGVVNLVNRLPAEHWRHAVIALDSVCERFAARVQRSDVQYIALDKGRGHLLRHYPRLAALFRRLAPAIVHTRNLAGLEATVPAWWSAAPVRIHGEHGWDVHDAVGDNVRYQHVRRLYMPFVHHYVALSGDLARYLQHKIGVPPARITRICNGVDVLRFAPPRAQPQLVPPPGFPFAAGDWLVGTVGRLEAVKDQCNLAHAFVLAVQRTPDAARRMRLVIVGDGPLRAAVRAILAQAGVERLAWFAGERDDVPQLLQLLDCFALPSQTEGISNTLLEAMACGRCIVATRVGGNAELIEHEVSGTLVPPRDPLRLSAAILRYFADTGRARAHAAAARARAVDQFSLERMVAQYEQLYLSLLSARRPSAVASLAARPQL
jgi:sugar transferase (PEP-CTERM/EpsH1 system associated)